MDIENTLKGTTLGKSAGDAKMTDLGRGYYDAGPKGDYQGSLLAASCDGGDYPMVMGTCEVRHPGQIESDRFRRTHDGDLPDEYGFVRRPHRRGDVDW